MPGPGPAYTPVAQPNDMAELYNEIMKRWACWGCSKPTEVIYPATRDVPPTFRCPVNRYAPFAASHNCASFEAIPGYDELWIGETRASICNVVHMTPRFRRAEICGPMPAWRIIDAAVRAPVGWLTVAGLAVEQPTS